MAVGAGAAWWLTRAGANAKDWAYRLPTPNSTDPSVIIDEQLEQFMSFQPKGLQAELERYRRDTGRRFPVLPVEVVIKAQVEISPDECDRILPALCFANVVRLVGMVPVVINSSKRKAAGDRGNHSKFWALDLGGAQVGNQAIAVSECNYFKPGGFGLYVWGVHYDSTPGPSRRRWMFDAKEQKYVDYDPSAMWWYNDAEVEECRRRCRELGYSIGDRYLR